MTTYLRSSRWLSVKPNSENLHSCVFHSARINDTRISRSEQCSELLRLTKEVCLRRLVTIQPHNINSNRRMSSLHEPTVPQSSIKSAMLLPVQSFGASFQSSVFAKTPLFFELLILYPEKTIYTVWEAAQVTYLLSIIWRCWWAGERWWSQWTSTWKSARSTLFQLLGPTPISNPQDGAPQEPRVNGCVIFICHDKCLSVIRVSSTELTRVAIF